MIIKQGETLEVAQRRIAKLEEAMARRICANYSEFCRNVGGDVMGCKVGRGLPPSAANCRADDAQLEISGSLPLARELRTIAEEALA